MLAVIYIFSSFIIVYFRTTFILNKYKKLLLLSFSGRGKVVGTFRLQVAERAAWW